MTTSSTDELKLEKVGEGLAPFACKPEASRGRLYKEPESATRTPFQRDRDRIIHCGAFRKLRNKTQVFIENEGDYFRTRLTHSLEVAQIARSAARVLGLNEDLAEAIALSHDLGHTCFGHSGEWALDEEMAPFGGFDHNDQTFRVLTVLEHQYLAFDGLNLTWETLEGVAKHNGPLLPAKEGKLPETIARFTEEWDLELSGYASLEAQIAAIADDIAYNTHDIDDGFRAGLMSFADVAELPFFGPALERLRAAYPQASERRVMRAAVRDVVGIMVTDLMTTTRANLARLNPQSVDDVRQAGETIALLSDEMHAHLKTLREFLFGHMYRHSSVNRVSAKSLLMVKDIFRFFMSCPNCLPTRWYARLQGHETDEIYRARLIADYIAGMTDPFAVQEHRRLFSTETMI